MNGLRVALTLATSGGGVGNHVRSLCAGLVGRGHRVVVVGPASTEERFGFTAAGARFAPLEVGGRPSPFADAAALVRLRGLLRGADVVHAHGVRAGALAALARPSAPLAATLHNAPPSGSGADALLFGLLERVLVRRADLVLGVSGDLVERMRARGARRTGRALVPAPAMASSGRDPAELRAELGVEPGRPLLVTVARLAGQKGLPVLLDAAGRWAARTPPPLVAVAGDGPLHGRLATRISAGSLPVRLLGRRTDVADLLAAADVFVLASVWEGQPLVIQEALRAGLPVVATDVGGVPDLVGDAALLVPYGDPAALADGVARILDDGALAARMRVRARAAAGALPVPGDDADQVLDLYAEVLSGSHPR
ncbi:glycosyltransferase family 4 protein [Actinorugispora endophytica]|uniref:Glycosyltransferase involved in cell wall biosynthesis n=1 Tax=Actinorugispora endophytica TaxID=1605990 RepID=A0A4R6UKZ1_9ACTN|nr:glycosyltransferase family 4 protein [Actinorugispora endophytica]TDQ47551.1 glycosyltransferase involved in cell wall biosynthesis [Actinorugispora endophytica]